MHLQNEMLHFDKILETVPLPPKFTDVFMFCEKCNCNAQVDSVWISKIGEHTYNLCCDHVVKTKVTFDKYEVM